MHLLIDSGNSRVKWATYDGTALSPTTAIDHGASEFQTKLADSLAAVPAKAHVVISDVRTAAHLVGLIAQQRPDLAITEVHANRTAFGVTNCYRDPSTLGSDRWAALIGAYHGGGSKFTDCVVIDCGTAITVDAVTADGQFIGGMILPSAWLIEQALSDGTSRIDRENWQSDSTNNALGQSTGSCVQHGAVAATIGGVTKACTTVLAEVAPDRRILVTGGDANTYLACIPEPFVHDPDLVLRGLCQFADAQFFGRSRHAMTQVRP